MGKYRAKWRKMMSKRALIRNKTIGKWGGTSIAFVILQIVESMIFQKCKKKLNTINHTYPGIHSTLLIGQHIVSLSFELDLPVARWMDR